MEPVHSAKNAETEGVNAFMIARTEIVEMHFKLSEQVRLSAPSVHVEAVRLGTLVPQVYVRLSRVALSIFKFRSVARITWLMGHVPFPGLLVLLLDLMSLLQTLGLGASHQAVMGHTQLPLIVMAMHPRPKALLSAILQQA